MGIYRRKRTTRSRTWVREWNRVRKQRTVKGYSLIQVLVSIAILAFIATGVLQISSQINNGIGKLQDTQTATQAIELVLERCRIDLKNNADYFPNGESFSKDVVIGSEEVLVTWEVYSTMLTGGRNGFIHRIDLYGETESSRVTNMTGWVYDES